MSAQSHQEGKREEQEKPRESLREDTWREEVQKLEEKLVEERREKIMLEQEKEQMRLENDRVQKENERDRGKALVPVRFMSSSINSAPHLIFFWSADYSSLNTVQKVLLKIL